MPICRYEINAKVLLIAIGGIVLAVGAAIIVQTRVVHRQSIELMRDTMRVALIEAENVRSTISHLGENKAFDRQALLSEYKRTGDLRGSTIHRTIPVVAAWQAIEKAAKENNWEFRVPKKQARNKDNEPTAEEAGILEKFETESINEYFKIDQEHNSLVFARPIKLTADCLFCHGDPANSPTGDGKDILGFQMENWKAGEVHGAFVLKATLDHVDEVVNNGMSTTLLWILPVTLAVAGGASFYMRGSIVKPLETAIASIDAASRQEEAAARDISAAAQRLAEGASEQAASLEQTSATMEAPA